MPRYKIREVDNTSPVSYGTDDNVVFIPGLDYSADATKHTEPILFTSARTFLSTVGKNGTLPASDRNQGFMMAYALLRLGMSVLYYSAGADKEEALKTKLETEDSLDFLSDKNRYNIRFVSFGGLGLDVNTQIAKAKEILGKEPSDADEESTDDDELACLKRKDATILFDYSSTETVESIIGFGNNIVAGLGNLSKYGAIFAPKCDFTIENISYESYPASFAYLLAFAQQINAGTPEYYAVAGDDRGSLTQLVKPSIEYSESDIYNMQRRFATTNVTCAINPIALVRPYGYVIWGNRTLYPLSKDRDLQASSFLNIRQLVSSIKKRILVASHAVTFDLNTDITWTNFKSYLIPTLDRMVTSNGISGYRIVRQEVSGRAKLKGLIMITPIEGLEDFDLTVELDDQLGATVTE